MSVALAFALVAAGVALIFASGVIVGTHRERRQLEARLFAIRVRPR